MTDTCIRKPGTVWTTCRCPDCTRDVRRTSKRYKAGIRPVDQRDEAIARIGGWLCDGYTQGAVASMTGLPLATVGKMYTALKRGRGYQITHPTAAKIMAATGPTYGLVPAVGVTRRLRALGVMGYSGADLAARLGVLESVISNLRSGRHPQTRAVIARDIRALYEQLWDKPGPSRYARARSRNKGWAGPLAWDDDTIDNPDVGPEFGGPSGVEHQADLRAELTRLVGFGLSDEQVAERMGTTDRTVLRRRARWGIESRWNQGRSA